MEDTSLPEKLVIEGKAGEWESLNNFQKKFEEASAYAQEYKDSQNIESIVGNLRERTYFTGEDCETIQVPTEYYDTVYTVS